MPAKRRTPKRRAAVLPDPCWRHLADLAEPGDEGSEDMVRLEYFADPISVEEAWERFGEAATAEHARVYPGRRPRLWWQFTAPEPERRKVAGTGQPSRSVLVRGISIYNDEDPAAPALVESEAAYLGRLGLPGCVAMLARLAVARPGPEPESPVAVDDGGFDQLAVARARLLDHGVLDPGLARLVAATIEDALAKRDRALAVALRRAGLRQRDELIRRAAAEFFTGKARARARDLLAAANRYATTGWLRDRGCVSCPEWIKGSVQELLWAAFKSYPIFPSGLRQMQNILAADDLHT